MTTATIPTITKPRAAIEAAIVHYDEIYARSTRTAAFGLYGSVPAPERAIRAKAKIKACEYVLRVMSADPHGAPLAIVAACDHWRIARKRLAKTIANGSYNERVQAIAQSIEAEAYIMAYKWALGEFDRVSRRSIP